MNWVDPPIWGSVTSHGQFSDWDCPWLHEWVRVTKCASDFNCHDFRDKCTWRRSSVLKWCRAGLVGALACQATSTNPFGGTLLSARAKVFAWQPPRVSLDCGQANTGRWSGQHQTTAGQTLLHSQANEPATGNWTSSCPLGGPRARVWVLGYAQVKVVKPLASRSSQNHSLVDIVKPLACQSVQTAR